MTQAPLRVVEARPPRPGDPVPMDTVVLGYDDRYLRRRVLTCRQGDRVLIDLDAARPLGDRERLVLATGAHVEVIAADEALIEVTAATPGDLARYAWHIGNRHMTCAIAPDRLLVRRDHVLADMLTRLGARLRPVDAPFDPEGGAYGHGRTHDHGHPDAPPPRAPDWQSHRPGAAPHTHAPDPHTHGSGAAPHTHAPDAHTHAPGAHTHAPNAHTHAPGAHTHTPGPHARAPDASTDAPGPRTHTPGPHTHPRGAAPHTHPPADPRRD